MLPCADRINAEIIDLNRTPDYKQISTLTEREKLLTFRNSLGDALVMNWKEAKQGTVGSGSCSQESFARWVDLYQWIDLLETDESAVMKSWLSRHLALNEQVNPEGTTLHVTMFEPGVPLNHAPVSPELLDKIMADDSMMSNILAKLVAHPFISAKGVLADRLSPDFIAATLADPDFLKRWSENFNQNDIAPKVLLNLQEIWSKHKKDWYEFQSLALALAVVKDQPVPDFWPHHQVAPSDVPREDAAPSDLFAEWVEASRLGKLRMDPRQLEVADLKFVVDPPLKHSEFASIRGNPLLAYQLPPKAFESIAYDQGRVMKNIYDWPWGAYLLSSIKARGGICVDQAYYAAISGKALGIPTIFFSGQGKDGGHAWIGYLKGPGQWDFNVARYASENYATGEGLDPQTWTPITDHDLDLLTRHLGGHEYLNAARRDRVIASIFMSKGDMVNEGRALQSALLVCPENPALWDSREEWLLRSGASPADLKKFHEAAIAQFSQFNDLKAQHQQSLLELSMRSGEKKEADQLAKQMVNENRRGWSHDDRTDLSAQAAWSMISGHLESKNYSDALEEFERQLRILGGNGGGDFFYRLVVPLTVQFIKAGRQTLALRVLKESYMTLKPRRDTLIDRDLRKLWATAGGDASEAYSFPRF